MEWQFASGTRPIRSDKACIMWIYQKLLRNKGREVKLFSLFFTTTCRYWCD
jgi:hypothetical protein